MQTHRDVSISLSSEAITVHDTLLGINRPSVEYRLFVMRHGDISSEGFIKAFRITLLQIGYV